MSDFPEVTLGELVSIKGGKRLPKGSALQVEETEHPYIRVRDMGNRFIDKNVLEYVPNDVFQKISRYIVNEGDVIISIVGTIGLVSIIGKELNNASQTENCAKLTGLNKSDAHYLYYFLTSKIGQQRIYQGTVGAVQAKLPLYSIEALPIIWPDSNHRKAIAHILGTLDDKIELNRKMNQTLEAMAQALFKSWFVDFDPVLDNALAAGKEIPEALKAKAEKRKAVANERKLLYTNPELAEGFPSSFTYNETLEKWVPEGWEVTTFGNEFYIIMGQSPPGSTYNEIGDGKPFFQGKTDFGFRFPTNRIYCTDPKREASKNDTLISVRAPVGNANLASSDCVIGRGLCAVRHNSRSISYTYYAVLQLKEVFDVFEGEGTVFGSINQTGLKSIEMVKPNESIIRAFDHLISSVDRKIELNTKETESLTQLRDTLLPKLISGKVRVPALAADRPEEMIGKNQIAEKT